MRLVFAGTPQVAADTLAHLLDQTRSEPSFAQNVIAHQHRKKIGVAPSNSRLANQHMGLGRGKRNIDRLRR